MAERWLVSLQSGPCSCSPLLAASVCVCARARVCVCVTQSAGTCVSGVPMCMHVTGGSVCGRRGHGGDTIAIVSDQISRVSVSARLRVGVVHFGPKCHLKCISRVVSERFVGLAAVSFSAVLEPGVRNDETRRISESMERLTEPPAFMSHLLRTFHPFARPPVPLTAARRPLTPGVCRM